MAPKRGYAGLAAVDIYLGATVLPKDDARNKIFPGKFSYGGGHVIQDLVAGKNVQLVASAYGTDCYPRKKLQTLINLQDLNEAVLFNPRNCYQNYICQVTPSLTKLVDTNFYELSLKKGLCVFMFPHKKYLPECRFR